MLFQDCMYADCNLDQLIYAMLSLSSSRAHDQTRTNGVGTALCVNLCRAMILRTTTIDVFSGCHETMMKDKADYNGKDEVACRTIFSNSSKVPRFRLVLALSVGDSKCYIVS